MNKKIALGVLVVVVIAIGAFLFFNHTAYAGPCGGDLVSFGNGTAYAEILANEESGELIAHLWKKDLKTPHPIPNKPITVGSDNNSVHLMPHPTPNDPVGSCSRFYGKADWVHGKKMHHGWLQASEHSQSPQEFSWRRCWSGGQSHGKKNVAGNAITSSHEF